jgi:hypothetical protein
MSTPSLDQYPGYFPPAKKPFWTRTKVGVACGVVGLMIGVAPADGSEVGNGASEPEGASQADVDAAVSAATDDLEQQLAAQEDDAAQQLEDQRAQARETRTAAVAAVRKKAKKDQKAAVAAAVKKALAQERASQPAAPPVQTLANTGGDGDTDPRFSYCYEANDAGYGPYQRGVDPEYDWYRDNDGDGIVCES